MMTVAARIPDTDIIKAVQSARLLIPLFSAYVQAGFPSPAENYIEQVCDLNDLCISTPEATYFVRAEGDSMIGDHIVDGAILVVDCAREVTDNKIVVVWVNGGNAVKRIHYAGELVVLMSSNSKYEPIYVQPGDAFKVYGVVTFVIHKAL